MLITLWLSFHGTVSSLGSISAIKWQCWPGKSGIMGNPMGPESESSQGFNSVVTHRI